MLINGEDLSAALHTDDVDATVSAVAAHPQTSGTGFAPDLRDVTGTFVVEGRDMGTAVFPGAAHKVYLTAPAEVRAQRRVGERAAGLGEVTAALKRRDLLDAKQSTPAPDAYLLETGTLTLDEVVARVLGRVKP